MTTKEKVFYFWGIMDVICIYYYIIKPFSSVGDLISSAGGGVFIAIYFIAAGKVWTALYVLIFIFTPVSLFFSAWFFFKKRDHAIRFALIQEVFRFITVRCSIPFFLWILAKVDTPDGYLGLSLSLVMVMIPAEILKIGSLMYVAKKYPVKRDVDERHEKWPPDPIE
ncbi:hypothetical protein [Pseudescherichia sp.]|uniref:hypothetical protein n=1 Tax=Pseudescherichia sp. TaxID=2055881 RepID=UPI0028AFAF10|nr:hypothetical protein [Pseudescherichia sp.]